MSTNSSTQHSKIRDILRDLSMQDFKAFGLEQIAYIRVIEDQGQTSYAAHSADGAHIFMRQSLADAIVEIRQNDLEPVTLH